LAAARNDEIFATSWHRVIPAKFIVSLTFFSADTSHDRFEARLRGTGHHAQCNDRRGRVELR